MSFVDDRARTAEGPAELLERIEYRLVDNDDDLEAIFRLRHESYVREGAVAPNPTGLLHDRLDLLPNCHNFGLWIDGRLAAAQRYHVLDRYHLESPAMEVFPDVLRPLIEAGTVVVDPTRLVCDAELSRKHPGLALLTTRIGLVVCDHFEADIVLATVREEHCAFYRRMFLMHRMADARFYPKLKKPVVMMGVRYPEAKARMIAARPFLAWTAAERAKLFFEGQVARGTVAQYAGGN